MNIDPITYSLRYNAEQRADEQSEEQLTCEQRRAREYGIDPLDYCDPTAYNAATIDTPNN